MTEPGDTSIKVLVRVRPLLPRELTSDVECLVSMPGNNLTKIRLPQLPSIHMKEVKVETKTYKFDESIWSYNKEDSHYTNNQQFYNKTGLDIIDHFFQGYNVCLLAYGQTSSGKTFTMMGDKSEPGLIPLIIRDILKQKEILVSERINCEVRFSYSEIYNEQVKDLLDSNDKKCRVREHPVTGPYVENLNDFQINTFQEFSKLLNQGNSNRSTASTSMNDQSSRSHAIITLTLKQTKFTEGDSDSSLNIGDAEEEMISSIKLVDLAGSERLAKTKVYGQQDRMKEGSLINKSLTVLGRCINILATQPKAIIPYRDSVLTYLLKENLGGNSKSFMIFCISPIDFEETMQTLNYANQVKMIKTTAKANKTKLSSTPIDWQELQRTDHDAISSLKDEINLLTSKLRSLEVEESPQHQDKFTKLMNFFERESSKVKFENKYLKKQLNQQSTQITEMNKYIDYMSHEYNHLHSELTDLQAQTFRQQKSQLASAFEGSVNCIDVELALFDPKSFLPDTC